MPNVLDAEPMRAFVGRAGGKIADEQIAARYRRMAFDRLLNDPRNFRPALPEELQAAADWVGKAQARGEEISVFKVHRSAAARLHRVASRLADTCKLAAIDEATPARDVAAIRAARAFLEKLGRASFDVTARKASYFSRVLAGWLAERDNDPLCAPQTVACKHGSAWHRVCSLSELRAVGREFHNCLARSTYAGAYGGMMRQGSAQFWVLRDRNGAGLIVAMAPLPAATYFTEVRGPRNAAVKCDDADLRRLARALGMGSPPNAPLGQRRACGPIEHALPSATIHAIIAQLAH